jgi:hypothetical protein
MNAVLSPLEAAKEQLSIPALWQLLNLPGKPARSCRSPFRRASIAAKPKRSRWNGPDRNHRPMEPTAKAFRSFASRCTFLADKQSQPLPGSLTARGPGIHAASQFLRHADIQVTAMHYADHKARVTVDMGARRNSARPQTRAREYATGSPTSSASKRKPRCPDECSNLRHH